MPVGLATFVVTTDAAGAGTVSSSNVLRGEILSVRMPLAGTALTLQGGTTDFLFTRAYDGATILSAANQSAPWQYQPREAVHTIAAGTTAYSTGNSVYSDSVPMYGTVTLTVAQGQPSMSGTVYVHYRR